MGTRPERLAGIDGVELSGTTVLLTGSTDGIGREAALALGRLGARVLVHGRDAGKGRNVRDRIREAGGEATLVTADFASLSAVRDMAGTVRDDCDSVDVLANNAGAYFPDGSLTDDGYERTIQVNHLAPFLLTAELADHLSPSARVVTTASAAHRSGSIDPDSFRSVENYDGFGAYARSKLANVLFARELATRLDGDRTANSFHPGMIPGTAVWRTAPAWIRIPIKAMGAIPFDPVTTTVADGAAALVSLAADPDLGDVSGAYFDGLERSSPASRATDDGTARRLWTASAEMVGVDPDVLGGRPEA